jgi:hypothetical protein
VVLIRTALVRVLPAFVLVCALSSLPAHAQRSETSGALNRVADMLRPLVEDGSLRAAPLIVVSAQPAFESTRAWYPTAVVSTMLEVFGPDSVRACEACMQPRVDARDGRLEFASGSLSLEEIIAIDTRTRGAGTPARAAAFVDEIDEGVSVRIVSLRTGEILFARNVDRSLREMKRTETTWNAIDDLERRLRGESLTHVFIDGVFLGGPHFSFDILEQFGDRNLNLAGLTVSAFDPVLGVGVSYHRVIPEAFNLTIGAQVIGSIPTIAVNAISDDVGTLIDPAVTGVLVARFPIPQTAFAVVGMASTNGRIGLGLTLMNFVFLPVLP